MKDLAESVKILQKALKEDAGYWMVWEANIAMAFKDVWQRTVEEGGHPCTPSHIHVIANNAAKYFLQNLTREIVE